MIPSSPFILLHFLLHEVVDSVRRKVIDTICDLANDSMACLTSSIFCHVPERRTQYTQMRLSHLFWMSQLCHRPSDGCRPSGVPRRFTGSTEGRGSSHFSLLASRVSLSLQSVSAIGPAHDASHFCILSHLFRSTPPPSFPLFPSHLIIPGTQSSTFVPTPNVGLSS